MREAGEQLPDMPLLEHLRELRRRLLHALVAVVLGVGVALAFADRLWDFLAAPVEEALAGAGGSLAVISPLEGVVTYLQVALLGGLLLASPYVFLQAWLFVAPALYRRERRVVLPLVLASTLLFLAGAAFGYFVIFRYAFPFFLTVAGPSVQNVLSMQAYLSTATRLLLAFGLAFQLPVVVFFLARLGILDARKMLRGFKYAVVGIFTLAAFLTPPDVLTQLLMAGPLLLLYGVGVGVAAVFGRDARIGVRGGGGD